MNSSLLAALGVFILVVIFLLLKMRAGKSAPEEQPEGEQEGLGEVQEEVVSEEAEGAEELVEEMAAAEPESQQETAAIVVDAAVEPVGEAALVAEGTAEFPPEREEEPVFELEAKLEAESLEVSEETGLGEEPELVDELVAAEDALPLAGELDEEASVVTVAPEAGGRVESREVAAVVEVEETPEQATEPVVAEMPPEEPELAEEAVAEEPVEATVPVPEPSGPEKSAETGVLRVNLSLEAYSEHLNNLEEQQRAALAAAIANNDDQRRDQLQRALVVMNDRLALVADHYQEDMAEYQQVLDALVRLQAEEPSPPLAEAISELQSGATEAAAVFLESLTGQAHPLAVQAAYLSGQLAESRVDPQKAMELYRLAVTQQPEKPEYLRAAGLMARGMYKYKEALPWLESYVKLVKEKGEADAQTVALAQRELAYTYVLSGQYQKAGPLYKESMTTLAQELGQDHPEMALSWQQIGEFQETMGEYDKAVSLYKKALAILEKKRGPEHPALAGILRKLAHLCVELELEPEAVPLYEKLVRIQEKVLRPTHPQLVISLNNLAEAYRLQGRYGDAEACYLKTLRINEELHGPEHPSVGAILQELAKLCTSQRKAEEAKQYQERATAIFQKSVEEAEKKSGEEEPLTLELS